MTATTKKLIRCAIYTRVSTDQGLEQDFNSLDAQYDASQAYIRSQAHAHWTLIRAKYDDGGFSGGNTDRPALQRLLADVRANKIDVIVVYKVDRLTRSLADFAKLVELFDQHSVSFVSVTQQFNTTTSMGRLTLNVLLSFAQFEREVTSERIRDKIAASKRKGLWVGGNLPLGYALQNRKLTIVANEAKLVRMIFQTYLKLGSVNRLSAELRRKNVRTKRRTFKSGRTVGGVAFTRGPLFYLLRNRFYIGEVTYKGEILPGPQPDLISRSLFDAVQVKLAEQFNGHSQKRGKSGAPLLGKIFDDRGTLMGPTHTRKKGRKYRYYISSSLLQGRKDLAGSVHRVPAIELESKIASALRARMRITPDQDDNDLIRNAVERVDVGAEALVVSLKPAGGSKGASKIRIPWKKPPSKRRREILLPSEPVTRPAVRPIRSDARDRLIEAVSYGRVWLDELVSGAVKDTTEIALREDCSVRSINMKLSLAFLAPGLVKAAIEGTLPRGIGYTRLCDLPPEWSRQYRSLGLAPLHR
jgi:DNA invertase Pin-like site-specific DNA recombinase